MTGLPFSLAYTRTRLSASTFPMFATNTPYPESQSYAIPLGKNCPQRGGAPCGLTLHMISQRRRTTSFTLGRMCVSEKAGFFLIKTHKYRGLLLELLRRLMRNCGRRGRSRNLMLAPNLLPKAVPHNGSRLLLGFIVRPDRRLVESQPPLGHTPPWPSHPPERPGGPDAGDPRPVASLPQRARLLAVRMGAPAPLLPYVVLPRPTQPARPSPGAGVAPLAACLRRGALGAFGALPSRGHDPHPGDREGEGLSQGVVRRPSELRTQRLQDRVGLRCARRGRPEKQLPAGVVESRSPLGLWQTPDHRRGDRPTQGLLRLGASSREDLGRAADASGR